MAKHYLGLNILQKNDLSRHPLLSGHLDTKFILMDLVLLEFGLAST